MPDPTVPRRGRPRAFSPTTTWGWFVRRGDKVVLQEKNGNPHPLEKVSIQQGSFGSEADGVERLPRPREYDAQGRVTVQGDMVRIDFLDGDTRFPLVSGGIRPTNRNDFLAYNHGDTLDRNRLRMRLQVLDATGQEVGHVELKAAEGDVGGVALDLSDVLSVAAALVVLGVTDPTSAMLVALADKVVTKLNLIENAFNAHVHASSGVVATPVPGLIPIVVSTVPDVASANVKAKA